MGLELLKSSWKPKALVSFTPTSTLSMAQPARGIPGTAVSGQIVMTKWTTTRKILYNNLQEITSDAFTSSTLQHLSSKTASSQEQYGSGTTQTAVLSLQEPWGNLRPSSNGPPKENRHCQPPACPPFLLQPPTLSLPHPPLLPPPPHIPPPPPSLQRRGITSVPAKRALAGQAAKHRNIGSIFFFFCCMCHHPMFVDVMPQCGPFD